MKSSKITSMKGGRKSRVHFVIPFVAFLTILAVAPAPAASDDDLDAGAREQVIAAVLEAFSNHYVYPEKAKRMCDHVLNRNEAGAYDDATTLKELCRRLRRDLRDLTGDRHIWIGLIPESSGDPKERRAARIERAAWQNFSFMDVRWLEGNVGYVRFDRFHDPAYAGETAVAAMQFIANCHAVIIDLRWNHGGEDQMVRLLASYFFEHARLLGTLFHVQADSLEQSWTFGYVPGRKLVDVPLYVLTSDETASGAEAFAYGMKHLGRATVVGEVTPGAAHWTENFDYPELNLRAAVPVARPVNPVTRTSWEGTGVKPNIAVSAEKALMTAHVAALESIHDRFPDPARIRAIDWVLVELRSELSPVDVTAEQLVEYAGNYGPRRVFLDSGDLCYQREGNAAYKLRPLGSDLFGVVGLDYFRLRFVRDDRNRVTKVVGLYSDGYTDENPRDKD